MVYFGQTQYNLEKRVLESPQVMVVIHRVAGLIGVALLIIGLTMRDGQPAPRVARDRSDDSNSNNDSDGDNQTKKPTNLSSSQFFSSSTVQQRQSTGAQQRQSMGSTTTAVRR
ncbi:hypothetical protein FGO68_gene2990 [Halteria grandinella]|uniref:Uncharacterized protein n=1 Tax=Halteria grandinella TaxID=5974 RepID=A0A8J8T362_HALGN|nr:hypothetical protein FGO68_gene2990 [Halteria grandinella]